ncbi:hypothetical protein F0919_03850 [Taibaiella lutea]|uniref:Lipoprotein n=1 Tax=Taibaiella lutea TaxID=2608001 RepID=A0A5M6CNV0_9BACT|nr:hypothetical protein [Taibaiella lutea]KAA5536814.1 hypothetical protein F0919_03850 [Taibaiella lutea]
MKTKSLIFLSFITVLISCELVDNKFTIINNSPNLISYYFTKDSTGKLANEFYSTYYYTTSNGKIPKEFYFIQSGNKGTIETLGEWDTDTSSFDNGTAYIYIIDSINIGREDTLTMNKLIRKYSVTIDYLKAKNWVFEVK